MTPTGAGELEALEASLLRAEPAPLGAERPPTRVRKVIAAVIAGVVSLFAAYHAVVLLIHNVPNKGLSRGLHQRANQVLAMRDYLTATGLTQSWAMFAPNPHRTNFFMRIFVEDRYGEAWDIKHDIYGRRRHPYIFYDRMGKINRRIIETKGYRRHYAAWVCREWERTHDGEAPVGVRMVKLWTQVPPPEKAYRFMYFDPMDLYLHQVDEDTYRCDALQQGQLPNHIRERYDLPPRPEEEIRDITIRTWWDRQQSERRTEVEAETVPQEGAGPVPQEGAD